MARILTVANRLPVTVGKTIKRSPGGLVSALEGLHEAFDLHWIGWPGTSVTQPQQIKEITARLTEVHCTPIFLSKKEVTEYYHGFANASIWPAFHYFAHFVHFKSTWWDSYQAVNSRFAETVAAEARPDDIVWVHDYHLMLVPWMLRTLRPELKIGFFLHTPFPSYEIFRCLPKRKEILQGLIGSDLIGFHTYGYLRHFRSSLLHLLNIETEMDRFLSYDRFTHLGVFPIGINAQGFLKEMKTRRFQKKLEHFRSVYRDKKIVLSVERLDYTKGIVRRLEAIERFLLKYEDKHNIVFIFVSVPSRDEVKEYHQLRSEVENMVGHINGQFATVDHIPIHFIHASIPFTELCALYAIADVAMVTPLIDGMNLVCKEYLACKEDGTGTLLLSEFAGASNELFDALIVNPYDIDAMVEQLQTALSMTKNKQVNPVLAMRKHVLEYDARNWAKTFIRNLEAIAEYDRVPEEPRASPMEQILSHLRADRKRAIFMDYDGTLREFENYPQWASPTTEILNLLKKLQLKRNLDLYLISGRRPEDLEAWFGHLKITLIAEQGFAVKERGRPEWTYPHPDTDLSWKPQIRHILEQYVTTTPGSSIEEKMSGFVWHYRRSEPEFGKWKAQQLVSVLSEMMTNTPVEVHHGNLTVQISSVHVNKGVAVQDCLRHKDYDVVLCAGDDQTDENMFRLEDPRIISVKVGKNKTIATYRLKDPEHFRRFLRRLP